ncbi:hypothetical protein NVP1149O_54 [Vibrio phage 1.149.O._10N.286.55.A12]|nr:hypothetical protein NVP1149O_54 [Vibrio phage 1.149.O._10N.286.55.A12]
MSDLDNAINSINASAVKAENTATFLDDMSTFDDQSSVTNPNNGQTVASIPKQVKDRTDELFTSAESDINQAVSDAAQSATDAQDAADSIGRYQGLWPDTGGSANKGDTYQTQVSGTPTGQYFTALQSTTVDPVGDDVNWRSVVSNQSLGVLVAYQADSISNMILGVTVNGSIDLSIGQRWVVDDYYGGSSPNNSGVLFFKVVTSGTGTADDGKYIDVPGGQFQLEQNMHFPIRATSYGVRGGSSFNEDVAAINRLQSVRMLNNGSYGSFVFDVEGELHFVGSVNCDRDDISIEIPTGCYIKSKYDSPSYPPESVAQSGAFLGIAGYEDPENGNFTVIKDVERVSVILNGDIETIYDPLHSNPHNNNAIGLFRAIDCRVTGSGGVSGSDHRGINFDGDCVNPIIDVAYINLCFNNAASLKGSPSNPSVGFCKIGTIEKSEFESVNYSVLTSDLNSATILIDSYDDLSSSAIDQLVFSSETKNLSVKVAIGVNASQIVRISGVENVDVSGISGSFFAGCTDVVRRGAAGTINLKKVSIRGAVSGSDCLSALDSTEVTTGNFEVLEVSSCDFSDSSTSFSYFNGETSNNRPSSYDIHSNSSPAGYTPSPLYLNRRAGQSSNLVTGTPTVFTYNPYSPDRLYSYITLRTLESGALYVKSFLLETLGGSSFDVIDSIGPSTLTISSSGNDLTFTLSSGSGQFTNAIAHN